MKKMLLSFFMLAMLSCNNNPNNNAISNAQDSLKTNPHAVPSHVDTITHEDGLHNQSSIPDTTTLEHRSDSLSH